jgi:hypothetical protein
MRVFGLRDKGGALQRERALNKAITLKKGKFVTEMRCTAFSVQPVAPEKILFFNCLAGWQ